MHLGLQHPLQLLGKGVDIRRAHYHRVAGVVVRQGVEEGRYLEGVVHNPMMVLAHNSSVVGQ